MLLLRLLFLFVVTARNMNGISRIGSFLFGQEDPELSADEPTRMVCSDSDDDGHSLVSGSERIHVDGDFNISVSPRDVVDPLGSPVSPLKVGSTFGPPQSGRARFKTRRARRVVCSLTIRLRIVSACSGRTTKRYQATR